MPAFQEGAEDLQVEIWATDPNDNSFTSVQHVTVRVLKLDVEAPEFAESTLSAAIVENEIEVPTGVGFTVTDADTPAEFLTYSISGGGDRALFEIDASSGELRFVEAPDFEVRRDNSSDNVYDLEVTVTDRGGQSDDISLSVSVTDIDDEAPKFGGVIALSQIQEGQQDVVMGIEYQVVDLDTPAAELTWQLSGGADIEFFAIDAFTGDLSFSSPPDFELPADSSHNNVYNVEVTVADSASATDTIDVAVTVNDVFEI